MDNFNADSKISDGRIPGIGQKEPSPGVIIGLGIRIITQQYFLFEQNFLKINLPVKWLSKEWERRLEFQCLIHFLIQLYSYIGIDDYQLTRIQKSNVKIQT